ncbi:hypothetical protein [Pseudonocardia sp. NPDC049635]|uniref:hypothetical protein n=1 Tax=Pseudonocardia sp. NPDC049635 TaxID=3155506 RepID=UPI0034089FE9
MPTTVTTTTPAEQTPRPTPFGSVISRMRRTLREVATGIDTWSAIRHGVVPLDDRRSPDEPRISG